MRGLTKKKNLKSEEHFHDEWAESVSIQDIDVIAQFEGITSPEYKEVIKSIGKIKGKKVLNIGCGLGEEDVYLARLGAKVTAIDISQKMIETTKKLAIRYNVGKNIIYFKQSVETMSFKDKSFDAIVGCNILHHVNIKKTIREVQRVLKPKGVAVFVEPLAYNPVINIYRAIAHKVRTDYEHPLVIDDILDIKKIFPKTTHKEFHLFTLFIFIWFFVVERQHPNKVRYWKKIISEAKKYDKAFSLLYSLDKKLLVFPFIKRYCWVSVITSQK